MSKHLRSWSGPHGNFDTPLYPLFKGSADTAQWPGWFTSKSVKEMAAAFGIVELPSHDGYSLGEWSISYSEAMRLGIAPEPRGLRYSYFDESAKVPAFSIKDFDSLAAKMARSSPRYSLADMEEALTKASAMAAVCEFFSIVRMAESIPMRAPVKSLPGLMVENGSMLNRWGRQ